MRVKSGFNKLGKTKRSKAVKEVFRVFRRDRYVLVSNGEEWQRESPPTRIKMGRYSNFPCHRAAAMAILKDVNRDGNYFPFDEYIITKQTLAEAWDYADQTWRGAYAEVTYMVARRIANGGAKDGKDPFYVSKVNKVTVLDRSTVKEKQTKTVPIAKGSKRRVAA